MRKGILIIIVILVLSYLVIKIPLYKPPPLGTLTAKASSITDWRYRRLIVIKEQSGNTLTNYPVLIEYNFSTLIEEGKIRPDLGDLRFADKDGNFLPYYIFERSGDVAKIFVKVPEIPPSGETKIYMYYGCESATSESDALSTGIIIEDWTEDTFPSDKWILNDPDFKWYSLEASFDPANDRVILAPYKENAGGNVRLKALELPDYGFYLRARFQDTGSSDGFRVAFYALDSDHRGVRLRFDGYYNEIVLWDASGDLASTQLGAGAFDLVLELYVSRLPDGNYKVKAYFDGTLKISYTGPLVRHGKKLALIGGHGLAEAYKYLWGNPPIIIRPYVDPEPTYTIGPEKSTKISGSWQYCWALRIENANPFVLKNRTFKIVLNTKRLVELGYLTPPDLSDLRFTANMKPPNDPEAVLIPYWIEPGTEGTESTIVWLKLPYLKKGTNYIYMWGGNPDALSESDVDSVFEERIGNLELFYRFEEGSGTTVHDYSGKGRDGTIYTGGNATEPWGWVEGGVNFTGYVDTSGGTVTIYHDGSIDTNYVWDWNNKGTWALIYYTKSPPVNETAENISVMTNWQTTHKWHLNKTGNYVIFCFDGDWTANGSAGWYCHCIRVNNYQNAIGLVKVVIFYDGNNINMTICLPNGTIISVQKTGYTKNNRPAYEIFLAEWNDATNEADGGTGYEIFYEVFATHSVLTNDQISKFFKYEVYGTLNYPGYVLLYNRTGDDPILNMTPELKIDLKDYDNNPVTYENILVYVLNDTIRLSPLDIVGTTYSWKGLREGRINILFKDTLLFDVVTDTNLTITIPAKYVEGYMNKSLISNVNFTISDLYPKFPFTNCRLLLNGSGKFKLYINYRDTPLLPIPLIVTNITDLDYAWDGNYLVLSGTLSSIGEINITDCYKLSLTIKDRLGNYLPITLYVNTTKYTGYSIEALLQIENYTIILPLRERGFEFYGYTDGYNKTERNIAMNRNMAFTIEYKVPTKINVTFVKTGETEDYVTGYFEAELLDYYDDPVPYRNVTLVLEWRGGTYRKFFTGTTDSRGVFTTPVLELYRDETYTISGSFEGDDIYVGTTTQTGIQTEALPEERGEEISLWDIYKNQIYAIIILAALLIILGIIAVLKRAKKIIVEERKYKYVEE